MSSQEEADNNPPIIFGRGTRTAVFFILDNTQFYDVKQKQNYSVLTSKSIAVDDPIIGSEATVGLRDFN